MTRPRLLALIPARGGSKRLPGKNKRRLAGRPLIEWTIAAALGSERVTRTVVSTDDPEIAEVARRAGADTPFLRPAELATDLADSVSVARHALEFLRSAGETYNTLALLQPTSPLRAAAQIDAAVELLERKQASAIVSVCRAEHTPLGMNTLPADRSMDHFLSPRVAHKRSQDLPVYYRVNGAIYLIEVPVFLSEATFFPKRGSYALIMDRESSVEIDEEIDWVVAESLMAARLPA
ncbi:MAG: acylneuraminate cytidylyltransferase family protein [Verrucomicrobia bacterium]|nr:acylneuraminate cytidylyltransferase family protein [Verrucomicrobiota bacterium]